MKVTAIGLWAALVLATLGLSVATAGGDAERAGVSSRKNNSAEGKHPLAGPSEGIAAKYPGDVGIESHPSVVFRETFEEGGLADLKKRWTSLSNKDGKVLALAKDSPPHSRGNRCIQMTATKGRNVGGYLWKLFKPGFDRLHARFYVKFAPDHPYVHHFVGMRAVRNSPNWPVGHAGHRPTGRDRFGSRIDLGSRNADPPGAWFLYSYWCEMRSYQTPEGRGAKCYGNPFAPASPAQAPRDKWVCVEFMIQANSAPDKRDGEQAFWIDGRLVGRFAPGTPKGTWLRDRFNTSGRYNTKPQPFEGFRWRTTNELKINTFGLETYLASIFRKDRQPKDRNIPYNSNVGRVWFDDIVIATEYIGPLAEKAAANKTTTPPAKRKGN